MIMSWTVPILSGRKKKQLHSESLVKCDTLAEAILIHSGSGKISSSSSSVSCTSSLDSGRDQASTKP